MLRKNETQRDREIKIKLYNKIYRRLVAGCCTVAMVVAMPVALTPAERQEPANS